MLGDMSLSEVCLFYAAAVLSKHLSSLAGVERVGLVSDTFTLAVGGYASIGDALDVLARCVDEEQVLVSR